MGPTAERLTPLLIFKRFLIQLLSGHPEIVSSPENLRLLSEQTFEQMGDSAEDTYELLAEVLKMVGKAGSPHSLQIFLIVDRVDICLGAENGQGKARFLRALHHLNYGFPAVHVILTSQYPAAFAAELLGGTEQLMEVWIDPSRPLPMYSR